MTNRSIDRLRQDAKALKRAFAADEPSARARVSATLGPRDTLRHAEALRVIAHEQGQPSWPRLKLAHEAASMSREARADRLKIALFHGQHWVTELLLGQDPTLEDANLGLLCALYRTEKVARVLADHPDAATRLVGIRTPMLHTAFSQHYKAGGSSADASLAMADLLLRHGADVNDSYPAEPGSPHRLSALYGALGHAGNLALAEWLLERGANPNDNESLYHACELGHADGVRLLLAHGAVAEGTNALPRAMDFNDIELVRALLDGGADPNEGVHPSGAPPVVIPGLHQAARRMCSADIAEALIDYGADGTSPYQGHTAYALARMRGNSEVARVLEAAGQATPLSPSEALIAAAADGTARGKVDPGTLTGEERRSLTRIVAFDEAIEHAKRLVAIGIDPDWTDEQGMPAIHIAGWEGQADLVAWLLTFGPDLTGKNMYGGDLMGTVIHGSEFCPNRDRRDHLRCARLVLDAGSMLHRNDIEETGRADLAEMLTDWAEDHPDRVIKSAG